MNRRSSSVSSGGKCSDSVPINIPAVTVTCEDDHLLFNNNRDSMECDVILPSDYFNDVTVAARPLLGDVNSDVMLINRGVSAPAEMPPTRQRSIVVSPTSDGHSVTGVGSGPRARSPSAVEVGQVEVKRRLVYKTGECNVSSTNVQQRKRRYIVDIFTTMLELKWRYNALVFILAFVTTWTFFGLLWLAVARLHGDHNLESGQEPCIKDVRDFTSAILFSIETQHTIGYGLRVPTNKCPEVVIIMMVQCCIGVFIQCLATGVLFAKLSRPKRRAQTIVFSQNAVICLIDDHLYLLFRVADMRRSHLVGASVRAVLVKNRLTKEGTALPLWQYPLQLTTESSLGSGDNYIFLAWPMTVMHRIDKDSPLWDVSGDSLSNEHFEIIVNLEGTVENTGMTAQVRTSYLPAEILWGYRLAPLVTYQKENGHYTIDHRLFHHVIPVVMSPASAHTLDDYGPGSGAFPGSGVARCNGQSRDKAGLTGSGGDHFYSNFTMFRAPNERSESIRRESGNEAAIALLGVRKNSKVIDKYLLGSLPYVTEPALSQSLNVPSASLNSALSTVRRRRSSLPSLADFKAEQCLPGP